jgi:hypothetical protein
VSKANYAPGRGPVWLAAAAGLVLAGCSSTPHHLAAACQCPAPVAYDDATLHKISEALRALPADNVLQRAMQDYENERDDLRFACGRAGR